LIVTRPAAYATDRQTDRVSIGLFTSVVILLILRRMTQHGISGAAATTDENEQQSPLI